MGYEEEQEAQHRMELAEAKLGVAEELGFAAAGFAAALAYVLSESWLLGIGAFIVIYRQQLMHLEVGYKASPALPR